MDAFQPNPNADSDNGFDVAAPGIYRLRVEGSANFPAVQDFISKKSGNRCLKVRFVFVDPSIVINQQGAQAKNLGSIIEQSCVLEPAEKQGKTKSLAEAAGIPWMTFTDITMLSGCEVTAKVGVDVYNGESKNVVERYLKSGA